MILVFHLTLSEAGNLHPVKKYSMYTYLNLDKQLNEPNYEKLERKYQSDINLTIRTF